MECEECKAMGEKKMLSRIAKLEHDNGLIMRKLRKLKNWDIPELESYLNGNDKAIEHLKEELKEMEK